MLHEGPNLNYFINACLKTTLKIFIRTHDIEKIDSNLDKLKPPKQSVENISLNIDYSSKDDFEKFVSNL